MPGTITLPYVFSPMSEQHKTCCRRCWIGFPVGLDDLAIVEGASEMSKFREAIKAGQLAISGPRSKSQAPYYCSLAAVFAFGLIKLVYAYGQGNRIRAIASIVIWWVIAPTFSWLWFRWRDKARKNVGTQ
jgi:hypothetical protein